MPITPVAHSDNSAPNALLERSAELFKRYYYGSGCYNGYYGGGYGYSNGYYCNSAWTRYGRWILLGGIILLALVVFFLFSCLTARRRRRMGYKPYPLTGWAARHNNNQQNAYVRPQNENMSQPPAYGNNTNAGYYGGNGDIQQPGATYNGYNSGAQQYQPPPGKPNGY